MSYSRLSQRIARGKAGDVQLTVFQCLALLILAWVFVLGKWYQIFRCVAISHICVTGSAKVRQSSWSPCHQRLNNQDTAWLTEHTSTFSTTTHYSRYLVTIDRKTKTIGIASLRGESSPMFVEDGDTSCPIHGSTWIFVFCSRTIPLHWTCRAIYHLYPWLSITQIEPRIELRAWRRKMGTLYVSDSSSMAVSAASLSRLHLPACVNGWRR